MISCPRVPDEVDEQFVDLLLNLREQVEAGRIHFALDIIAHIEELYLSVAAMHEREFSRYMGASPQELNQ